MSIKTKRLILHIGTAKTGSSALQYYFVRNHSLLEEHSILYYQPSRRYLPWQGQSNADFLLRSALTELQSERFLLGNCKEVDPMAGDASFIHQEMQRFSDIAHQYETVILSEECIWGQAIFVPLIWEYLKDQLHSILGNSIDIDIVVYLRRQDAWILSQWKEAVRGSRSDARTFFEYSEWCHKKGFFDYDSALLRIEDIFGHDNTIVRCYDKQSFVGGSIQSDFMDATSLSIRRENTDHGILVNLSFSISLTEALRLINAGEVPCMASKRSLLKAASIFSQLEGRRNNEYPLTTDERAIFLEGVRKHNLLLSHRYDGLDPLLNCSFPPYDYYLSDETRDRNNAIAISKLAEKIEKSNNGH